jgi:hypothetical protein
MIFTAVLFRASFVGFIMIFARLNKAVFEGFGTYSDFNTSTEEDLMAGFEKNIAVSSVLRLNKLMT